MIEPISEHHLARKAVLYVRQSSMHQLLHNQESRRLQYAMTERLRALGFWTSRSSTTISASLHRVA